MKIPKNEMLDILDSEDVISDTITGQRRWMTDHDLVFKYDGKIYMAYYEVPSTESQEGGFWEYEDEVECYEVVAVEKTVIVYEKVKP